MEDVTEADLFQKLSTFVAEISDPATITRHVLEYLTPLYKCDLKGYRALISSVTERIVLLLKNDDDDVVPTKHASAGASVKKYGRTRDSLTTSASKLKQEPNSNNLEFDDEEEDVVVAASKTSGASKLSKAGARSSAAAVATPAAAMSEDDEEEGADPGSAAAARSPPASSATSRSRLKLRTQSKKGTNNRSSTTPDPAESPSAMWEPSPADADDDDGINADNSGSAEDDAAEEAEAEGRSPSEPVEEEEDEEEDDGFRRKRKGGGRRRATASKRAKKQQLAPGGARARGPQQQRSSSKKKPQKAVPASDSSSDSESGGDAPRGVPVRFASTCKDAVHRSCPLSNGWHVYESPAHDDAMASMKLRCGDAGDLALVKYYVAQVLERDVIPPAPKRSSASKKKQLGRGGAAASALEPSAADEKSARFALWSMWGRATSLSPGSMTAYYDESEDALEEFLSAYAERTKNAWGAPTFKPSRLPGTYVPAGGDEGDVGSAAQPLVAAPPPPHPLLSSSSSFAAAAAVSSGVAAAAASIDGDAASANTTASSLLSSSGTTGVTRASPSSSAADAAASLVSSLSLPSASASASGPRLPLDVGALLTLLSDAHALCAAASALGCSPGLRLPLGAMQASQFAMAARVLRSIAGKLSSSSSSKKRSGGSGSGSKRGGDGESPTVTAALEDLSDEFHAVIPPFSSIGSSSGSSSGSSGAHSSGGSGVRVSTASALRDASALLFGLSHLDTSARILRAVRSGHSASTRVHPLDALYLRLGGTYLSPIDSEGAEGGDLAALLSGGTDEGTELEYNSSSGSSGGSSSIAGGVVRVAITTTDFEGACAVWRPSEAVSFGATAALLPHRELVWWVPPSGTASVLSALATGITAPSADLPSSGFMYGRGASFTPVASEALVRDVHTAMARQRYAAGGERARDGDDDDGGSDDDDERAMTFHASATTSSSAATTADAGIPLSGVSVLLLCEVACGMQHRITSRTVLTDAPGGCHSVRVCGRRLNDPAATASWSHDMDSIGASDCCGIDASEGAAAAHTSSPSSSTSSVAAHDEAALLAYSQASGIPLAMLKELLLSGVDIGSSTGGSGDARDDDAEQHSSSGGSSGGGVRGPTCHFGRVIPVIPAVDGGSGSSSSSSSGASASESVLSMDDATDAPSVPAAAFPLSHPYSDLSIGDKAVTPAEAAASDAQYDGVVVFDPSLVRIRYAVTVRWQATVAVQK